jgi:hypothetical protein
MTDVSELVAQGLIEAIRKDPTGARRLVEEAERRVASAAAIAKTDPDGAYALLWDATRKAIVSHMVSAGFRAKHDRPGAHRAVVLYAEITLPEYVGEHVDHLDRMRRTRNRSEYASRTITEAEVEADLAHARPLVETMRKLLG